MDTFFFGYLPLKWKRLARVLSFILYGILYSLAFDGNWDIDFQEVIVVFGTPFFVFVLSWIVKPFIVKEK